MDNVTTFLIDGIDRLGKSTLCENIRHELGYAQLVHSSKPVKLDKHRHQSLRHSFHECSLERYQRACNANMFKMISSGASLIFDRTHLGEMVYAPLYRKYDGDYVFDLEANYNTPGGSNNLNARLVLLITTNFEMLKDDGESFNWDNKVKEQQMFLRAFIRSNIRDKVIVDVHDGKGGYKSFEQILMETLKCEKLLYFDK